jgi:hypothetical protein
MYSVHLPASACPDHSRVWSNEIYLRHYPHHSLQATTGRNNYLLLLPPIPILPFSLVAACMGDCNCNILNLSNLWIDDEADPGDGDEENAGNIHLRSNKKCLRSKGIYRKRHTDIYCRLN